MDKDLTHHILYVSHKTGHDQRITLNRGTQKLLKCIDFKAIACLGEVCTSGFKSLLAAHYVWNSLYFLLSTAPGLLLPLAPCVILSHKCETFPTISDNGAKIL